MLPPLQQEMLEELVEELDGQKQDGRWNGPGSTGLAGWFKPLMPPPVDVTQRFRQLYRQVQQGVPVLPAEASRHQYLLVKGMFGEALPTYMVDGKRRLQKRGLEVLDTQVHPEQSLAHNMAVLREALLDAVHFRRSVVLVAHSKGATEALSTLSRYPELRPAVRAVVALQTVFGGSVIANDVTLSPRLWKLAERLFPLLFRGDALAVRDLSYARRQEFLRRHPCPRDIPITALAASRLSRKSALWPLIRYVNERYGWRTDGMVATVDEEVPGSRLVRLEDMDHGESVMLFPGLANYSAPDVMEALVALGLESPAPDAP